MRRVVFVTFILLLPVPLFAQVAQGFDLANYGVRIEPDRRVMAVLATVEAARTVNEKGEPVPVINTPLSAAGSKFREQLRSDLAALNDDLRQRISAFVIRYKRSRPNATNAELVSPFISMAYTLSDVPELADPVVTADLPGSLLDVLDFAPLVRDFCRRSSFTGNLNEYVNTYRTNSDALLRGSAREMVTELLSYLRTRPQLFIAERIKTETQRSGSKRTTLRSVETRERERRFVIVPEMLAPVGTVNFVNIKDDYYVVLPPDTDLSFSEVRRGYLQFVIDPIVLGFPREVTQIRDPVKQLLDARRKINPEISPDVYLTIARSLVAAIDTKQLENERIAIATAQARQRIAGTASEEEKRKIARELDNAKLEFADETALRLSEDYEKGAILVFYFAEQLKGIEDSGFDIAASMREMLLSFDPSKERDRLGPFADARQRALAAREKGKTAGSAIIVENPVTTRLLEIQETIAAKNYRQAEADLKKLVEANPGEARIHFSIGRVAALAARDMTDEELQKAKLLEAKSAYENVIRINATQRIDPALVSLSYVALGKIYEFYEQSAYAIAIYDAAIKVGDVPGGGFSEALAAKQRLLKQK